MVIIDGIIYSLQQGGGISVYFDNIISRISCDESKVFLYSENFFSLNKVPFCLQKSRFFERYRNFVFESDGVHSDSVFHSSYYRLPTLKMPTVTTVHDFTYEKYNKGLARCVHSWQKNKAIRSSDIIICVSENTASDLMNYINIPESRIRVVYNGVSEIYTPLCDADRVSDNKVVFIGARGGYKNFDIAVQSVSKISFLELSIVGGGNLNEQEKKLLEHYLPNRYRWLGRLSDEDLNKVYNRAYCLLYPSSYEGFGIPVVEAMRAGCPVVAVNTSSIPEVAGSAGLLVDTPDCNEFVYALLNIDKSRQKLISAGFTQSEKFSWEKCFNQTQKVYNELLS